MLDSSVNILPKMKERLFLALLLICCIQVLRGQQPSIVATIPLLKDPTVLHFRCSLGLTTVSCGAVFANGTAIAITKNIETEAITTLQLSSDASAIRVSTTTGGNTTCFAWIETTSFRIQQLDANLLPVMDFSPDIPANYSEFTIRGGNNACHVLLATDYQLYYKRWDPSDPQSPVFGNAYNYIAAQATPLTLAAYLTSPYQALGCWRDTDSTSALCAVFSDGGSSIVPFPIGTGVSAIQAMVLANPERSVVIFGQGADTKSNIFQTTGADSRDFAQNSTSQFGFSTSLVAGTVQPGLLSILYVLPGQVLLVTYDQGTLVPSPSQFVITNNLTNVVDVRYSTMTPAFTSPYSLLTYKDPSIGQYTGLLIRNFYCGDGLINQGEQCDGGFRCASCSCTLGFTSTVPASIDCQAQPNQGRTAQGETTPVLENTKVVSCAVNDIFNSFACITKTLSSGVSLYVVNGSTNAIQANYTLVNVTGSFNFLLIKSMPNGNWAALIPGNTSALYLLVISGTTSQIIQQDITTNLSTSSGLDMLVYTDQSIGIFFYRSNSLYYKRYSSSLVLINLAMELALTSIDFDVVNYKAGFLVMNQDPQAFTVVQYNRDGSNRQEVFTLSSPIGTASLPNLVSLETQLLAYYRVANGPSSYVNLVVYNSTSLTYLANYTYDSSYLGTILDIAPLPNDFAVYYDQTGLAQIVQFFVGQIQPLGGIFPWDSASGGTNNFTSVASSSATATFISYWLTGNSLFIQSSAINTSIVFPVPEPSPVPVDPASPLAITPAVIIPSGQPPSGELPGWTIALIVILVALVVGSGIFLAIFFIQRDRRKKKKKRDSINLSPTLPSRLSVNVTADDSHYNSFLVAINSPHSADKSHHSTSKSSSGTGIDLNGAYNPNNRWEINPREISISEKLGGGAFGVIYKGRWKYTVVAIKSTNIDSDLAFEELKKEALLMTSVRPHPNILPIFGYYREGEKFNLVMEFQGGGNLYTMLKNDPTNPAFSNARLINLVHGIASGLEMLHSMNIVHRDIAARNILMSDSGVPKVSDFGMARAIGENKAGITTSNIGPIAWMAPESLRSQLYSDKTDVWAFGVLLWEIVAKKDPFAGTQLIDLAIKIREGLTLPIPDDCPEVFRKIMNQCWEFNPEDRPSMSVILAELDEYKTVK
eukprot:TRINITY_DN5352_c0_g1_i2.p1 TRINITY_DN5352_c0_g1~~TRINITY_DN5352_c0_g1_i2.p1  ORF type:complete len:1159 (-),score=88.81 TRINITY_DN5352_c0_g1_i2:57-3533(-)